MDDRFDLDRFVTAQRDTYSGVLSELQAGRKQTHWMWFIFPQIAGLGSSATARHFALSSLDEAKAYLAHPMLGLRIRECVLTVNETEGLSAHEIFGSPDDVKFRSSMTLFSLADPGEALFGEALARFYDGKPDRLTLERIGSAVAGKLKEDR